MYFAVKLLFLFWTNCGDFTTGLIVTYEELKELNATCNPDDTCVVPRADDSPGITWSSSCSCNRFCSRFGTCCMDSFYNGIKSPRIPPTCRTVKLSYTDASYFMVDRCSNGGNFESVWETLCNEEWNGENDVMKLVPVTSLFTSMTYKNYFCFRCHETSDDFFYWNVWLKSNSTCNVQPEMKDVELTYNNDNKTWVVTLEKSNVSIPVVLMYEIPFQIWSLPIECEASVISNCSGNWTDDSTRDKCHAYTAIIYVETDGIVSKYRNSHCALCNFESLDKMFCKNRPGASGGSGFGGEHGAGGGTVTAAGKAPFSFTHLLDINRSDGDKVGKIQKCEGNFLWDPFATKCRGLTCALEGYVVEKGKCVPR